MSNVEQKTLDYLIELKGLNNLNNGKAFKLNLSNESEDSAEFKYSVIDSLYKNGAIEILDKAFGNFKNKKGERVNVSNGAPLEMFGYKPIEMLIKINEESFKLFYRESKQKAEELVKCSDIRDKACTLTANESDVTFTGVTSAILNYMYSTRMAPNYQDFESFNKFLAEKKLIDYFAVVDSIQFSHKIKAINKRAIKDTNKYINLLIETLNDSNKKNKYKWKAEITEM